MKTGGAKKFEKYGVKKIGITEFYVEYLLSRSVEDSVMEKRSSSRQAASSGLYTYNYNVKNEYMDLGDWYDDITDGIYGVVVNALTEYGFEVIDKGLIANHALYTDLEFATESKARGYTGGLTKKSVTTTSKKYSVDGLGIYPTSESGLKGLKVMKMLLRLGKMEIQVMKDFELDGLAKIHMFIEKGKNGEPVVTSFVIDFLTGLEEKKGDDYLMVTSGCFASLEKPLKSVADVSGEGKGSIDFVKYNEALLEIVDVLGSMAGASWEPYIK